MLPKVLHYATSDEDASEDPEMVELHEMLEQSFPGYLDHDEVSDDDNVILQKIIELFDEDSNKDDHHIAAGPVAPMPTPAPGQVPEPNSAVVPASPNQMKEICPWHGKVKIDSKGCESCSAIGAESGAMQAGKNPTVQNRTPHDVYDPDRDGPLPRPQQQATSKVATDHQGPHTKEQFIAVAELLEEEGREDEIVEMLREPRDYSEELAKIQGVQPLTTDAEFDSQSNTPPVPAQEGAAPNQGMPVPPMGGPAAGGAPGGGMQMGASMLKAAFKYSADNVAGKCPKCKGHSTKMIRQDGKCKCHSCGHTWIDKHFEPSDGDSSNSSTTASYLSFNDLSAPDIDSHDFDDFDDIEEGHSSETQSWKDSNGEPLVEGQEYSMKSKKSDLDDRVRIVKINPDSIKITINDRPKEEELTLDDIHSEGHEFAPLKGDNSDNPHGIEENPDGKPLPEVGSDQTDLSTPHHLVQSKIAGKHYTPMEQRELIDERGEARNSDKLDLRNTHYIENDDDYFLFGC